MNKMCMYVYDNNELGLTNWYWQINRITKVYSMRLFVHMSFVTLVICIKTSWKNYCNICNFADY